VPYPVDYGGVFDLFYKLPALQQAGIKIHLHCFNYGRGEQNELNKYCESITYYKRRKNFSFTLPYIVSTRKNEELLQNLLKNDYPILMEGTHSTYLLNDVRFNNRKKIVRLHNVEFEYYQHLYKSATSTFKKIYYLRESRLLKKYEQSIIKKVNYFLSVSEKDTITYQTIFNCSNVFHLPLFLPKTWQVNSLEGKGNYCLFNGDLSVDINEKVANWLLKNAIDSNTKFIIAGKNPSLQLQKSITVHTNCSLIANPNDEKMSGLIKNAHIHVLPSFSNTGIKLKLLNALFNGRFCLVNNEMVEGSELKNLCEIANSAKEFKVKIAQLMQQEFSEEKIVERKKVLNSLFNNEANAEKLIRLIWNE
jgi:glycosyltransferase involved in cell wall biosynthesis